MASKVSKHSIKIYTVYMMFIWFVQFGGYLLIIIMYGTIHVCKSDALLFTIYY